MKTICLNIQDCGYTEKTPKSKIKNWNPDIPFATCPLCGYYTVTITKNVISDIDLNTYKKIYKQLRKDE
jgi:hypothetical protein